MNDDPKDNSQTLQDTLERGAEPFWMQDVRIAQQAIEGQRLASRIQRPTDSSKPSEDLK
jgi:uncharacterized membrane protein